MGEWLLSIAGVITLSVLTDILLPEGQTNKYIKGIFSVITLFVIISPLPKLFSEKFSYEGSVNFDAVEFQTDENYLKDLADNPFKLKESAITSYLTEKGLPVTRVTIVENCRFDGEIDYINVFLTVSELTADASHNIISKDVKTLVSEFSGVDAERVRVLYD